MFLLLFTAILFLAFNCKFSAASNTNFQVSRFEVCNNTQGIFKYFGNITRIGDEHYLDGTMHATAPLDETVGVTCKIEMKVANSYVELFTIREKYMCKAANMYMGEMWYDIQRAAQLIPGQCPMPPRRYTTHHVLLDFKKMSLQTFPFGYLRLTIKLIDNNRPTNKLLCLFLEVENVAN